MENSKLRNVTAILSRVIEIACWLVAACLIVSAIVLTINRNDVMTAYESGMFSADSVKITGTQGDMTGWFVEAIVNGKIAFVFFPYTIILVLTAFIFKGIYDVFKKSNTASPFSIENVNRIKKIGYLAIAIPVCKAVMQLIVLAAVGGTDVNLSISLSEFVFGLVALCLSQYFAYGAQLESDVEGLL